jgi:hypothetical protein
LAAIAELQDQLLARERELDSQEGTIVTWEESLMASARALGETCEVHDARRAHEGAVWRDYLTQVSVSSSQFERCKALYQTLYEHAILLGLQEIDLGVREAILAEELERGLRHPDGRDLPTGLDKTCARVHEIAGD